MCLKSVNHAYEFTLSDFVVIRSKIIVRGTILKAYLASIMIKGGN